MASVGVMGSGGKSNLERCPWAVRNIATAQRFVRADPAAEVQRFQMHLGNLLAIRNMCLGQLCNPITSLQRPFQCG